MKKIAIRSVIILAVLIIVFLSGPRTKIDPQVGSISLPPTLAELDQYLAQSEARYTDIVPGTEKTIIWANAEKTRTPISIVYIHGYSASRQETAPLSDELAAQLGANLFYTRLSGHGRTGAAMTEPTVNDWLNDTNEAFEIGKRLGEKVIVIGVSTGGPLAVWLAEQPNTAEALAYILISPNFAPHDKNAEVLTLPWAKQFAPLLLGDIYSWTPENSRHDRYWTHSYPSTALVTMMGLVKFVRNSDLASIRKPVLVIYSPNDTVVDPNEVEKRYAMIGSDFKEIDPLLSSGEGGDPSNHVLAGDVLSPNNTGVIRDLILDFLARVK